MSSHRPGFNWQDPFLLDSQLSEEERMIRESAHKYAQENLMLIPVCLKHSGH